MKRPVWYKTDVGLNVRMSVSMILMAALYAAFILFLGLVVHVPFALLLLAGVGIALFQYFLSDKMALLSINAQIVDEQQSPKIHSMIDRLSQQANIAKPKIAIARNTVPNAFATGRDEKHSVICVTTGLLDRLNDSELEAVLAHEVTHIVNRDVFVMTIAMFIPMIAGILIRVLGDLMYWGALFGGFGGGGRGGRSRDDNGFMAIIAIFLASIIVSVVSFFLTRAFSRYREYAADRGSALITGAPQNLSSALMRISNQGPGRIPDKDLRSADAVSAFCFVPISAFNGNSFGELFSTHPTIQHRLERLNQIEQRMEQAPHLH